LRKLFKSTAIPVTKMARDKISMPSSTAGITRYFDDYRSKIELKPGHVIIIVCVVILIEILLHALGKNWFGI
jgi:preprotein translocase subunit Sec61beta